MGKLVYCSGRSLENSGNFFLLLCGATDMSDEFQLTRLVLAVCQCCSIVDRSSSVCRKNQRRKERSVETESMRQQQRSVTARLSIT